MSDAEKRSPQREKPESDTKLLGVSDRYADGSRESGRSESEVPDSGIKPTREGPMPEEVGGVKVISPSLGTPIFDPNKTTVPEFRGRSRKPMRGASDGAASASVYVPPNTPPPVHAQRSATLAVELSSDIDPMKVPTEPSLSRRTLADIESLPPVEYKRSSFLMWLGLLGLLGGVAGYVVAALMRSGTAAPPSPADIARVVDTSESAQVARPSKTEAAKAATAAASVPRAVDEPSNPTAPRVQSPPPKAAAESRSASTDSIESEKSPARSSSHVGPPPKAPATASGKVAPHPPRQDAAPASSAQAEPNKREVWLE